MTFYESIKGIIVIRNQNLLNSIFLLYNRLVELSQKDPQCLRSIIQEIGQWEEDGKLFCGKELPQWDLLVFDFQEVLKSAQEWTETLSEIKKDEIIMKHIGKFAGNPTGARRIELEELIRHFLSSALSAHNGTIGDHNIFNHVFEEFEEFFCRDEISVSCRVILDNFQLMNIEALNFNDYICIRKLDITEINRLYRELFFTQGYELFRPEACYEAFLKFKTKKVLFEPDTQSLDMFKDPNYRKIQSQIEEALLTIKLAVGGGMRPWLILFEHHAWGYGGGFGPYTVPERMGRGKDSIVQDRDVALIIELWKEVKNENFKKDLALQVAIRRFVFSLDR